MALEGARRALRRQNSGEWLHSRASNQEGTIFITVHGVKERGGKKKKNISDPLVGTVEQLSIYGLYAQKQSYKCIAYSHCKPFSNWFP